MASITNQVPLALANGARWLEENSDLSYAQAFSYLDSGSFSCFSQLWSNTSCGFGGFAGQAFTVAVTMVFFFDNDDGGEDALVLVGGRVAYRVREARENSKFMLDLVNQKLVGQEEFLRDNPYTEASDDPDPEAKA